MRVLFLAPYVPLPVRHGGANRTLGLIRAYRRFATVEVLAIGDPGDAALAQAKAGLSALGVGLDVHPATGPGTGEPAAWPEAFAHFRSPSFARALERNLAAGGWDVVHFEELVMAQYRDAVNGPACILDRQKIEWRFHEAMADLDAASAARQRAEASRFRAMETATAGRFDAVLATTGADRDELVSSHGAVAVVEIAVDASIRRAADRTRQVRRVLLYGSLDYPPNVEAHARFFKEVWPVLRARDPSLGVVVAGSGGRPPGIPDEPGVSFAGYVPEIGELLKAPAALVVPLRVGGGARTKVLEALAAGMPVVSTAVGVAGLGLVAGAHYLAAETPEAVVEAVLALARDPERAAGLSRAGSDLVEARFRDAAIAATLEPIARAAAGARRVEISRRPARGALLVGVGPWPREAGAREHSFPGHRTEQFVEALLAAGCEVTAVVLAEGSRHHGRKAPRLRLHSLPAERFRAGVELQAIHDAAAPDVVVAAGGYHAARVVSGLTTSAPRWIDLPGDLAAEGQLRAHAEGDARLRDPLSVLARALTAGDQFSVVGASQRLALLGQLGLCGRLTGATLGQEPVAIVPLACDGPVQAAPLAAGPLRLLWYGGYNTWMDAETLLAGLESALGSDPELRFESTGGAIRDHDELSYGRFWERARASPVAARLLDHGRIPRRRATALLDECHVVLCLSRACLESELGSRFRLIEALAHGRPVVATRGGDLARDVELAEAGILVRPGEPEALARAVLALASDRRRLEACARNARSLWQARFTYTAATEPLRAWLAAPRCWPRSILGEVAAADSERQRLQSELDAIRGSRTFRALRIFDRLTRRGGEGR